MDNNTKEAIEGIDWNSLSSEEQYYLASCYYPASCFFGNESAYLEQFPNKIEPDSKCLYAIYCGKLAWNFTGVEDES